MNNRRVAVLQVGARRNYIAPRQLEDAGLLHSLICDAAWVAQGGGVVKMVASRSPRLLAKLERRTVRGIPPERVIPSFAASASRLGERFLPAEHAFAITDDILGWSVPRRVLNDVHVVLNYFGNGGSFLQKAKRAGKIVVTDFINHPMFWRTVEEEQSRWPGLEHDSHAAINRTFYERRVARLVEISDLYLCPSESVADGLSTMNGFDRSRVRLVPYGASGFQVAEGNPVPGRILCAASTVSLIKGVTYLAQAAAKIKSTVPNARFIVAGSAPEEWSRQPEFADLEFVGALSKADMAREFAKADVFCLPSLAEGSATVIYEALANRLPIVTTPSSGSVVQDGVEGYLVPERDTAALTRALEAIIRDRDTRTSMSRRAAATSERFNDSRCGELFVSTIREALRLYAGRHGTALSTATGPERS